MAQYTIRVPDELDARVQQAASEDTRSKNGEINWLLRLGLAARTERPAPQDPRWVVHKDGNPRNLELSNLEPVDPPEENQR